MDKELLAAIGAPLEPIRQDITGIKNQQKEDHAILRALEEASSVHKAGIDDLTYSVELRRKVASS